MQAYIDIIEEIYNNGYDRPDRTGVGSRVVSGMMFKHDMAKGFPLVTVKKTPFHLIASELEFFIKGLTDKAWLQERNNHIWDEWCAPAEVPYGHDEETKAAMVRERDLGPIYGWQWRHWGTTYCGHDLDYEGCGIDQLQGLIDDIKNDPHGRRKIVTAWNPRDLHLMGLPPCFLLFQVVVTGSKLNIIWYQRSVDSVLGLPFDIASHALMLHLLALETGYEAGTVTGMLGDVHIYDNHLDSVYEFIDNDPRPLPTIETEYWDGFFNWEFTHSILKGYNPHPAIRFPIAV